MTALRWMFTTGALLALVSCASAVTADQIARIHPGMKPDEVEAILGRPTQIDQSETTSLTGTVNHYPSAKGEGRVIFLNDLVFKAEFIPGAKS